MNKPVSCSCGGTYMKPTKSKDDGYVICSDCNEKVWMDIDTEIKERGKTKNNFCQKINAQNRYGLRTTLMKAKSNISHANKSGKRRKNKKALFRPKEGNFYL